MTKTNKEKRERRHFRVRAKISGTSARPRLAVFKSNRFVYAQIIDDTQGKTLAHSSTNKMKGESVVEKSKQAGVDLAKKALKKGVKEVVFDKGGFNYTGKIKSLASGAREGGLKF